MSNDPAEKQKPERNSAPGHDAAKKLHAPEAGTPASRPPRRGLIIIGVIGLAVAGLLGAIWWNNHNEVQDNAFGGRGGRGGGGGGGFGGGGGGGGGRRGFAANGPQPVMARAAQKGDLNVILNALGTVAPLATVTVKTQISGQLMQVNFQEGQEVNKGDLLAVIDPRPYEATLAQAQGQLLQAQSQLKEAQIDLSRYETLAQQDSIAMQQVDTQRALVNQYTGLVQTDQAAIDSAKLNITYCHIVAPVSGRVGLRQVDQGNYVTPGDSNGLVVITQMQPITVVYTLPEDNIPQVSARLRAGAEIPVDAYDRAQTKKLATGSLATIDNEVDPSTGTFKLRAIFPNQDESLFPNQFVNIRMLLDIEHGVTLIPTSAVERGQDGAFVYVVKPDSTATARPITLGLTEGERVAVESGLQLGDLVVVDGADRLREGVQVIVQGDGAATLHPKPAGDGSGRRRRGGGAGGDGAPGADEPRPQRTGGAPN
jgi:multidrug efflux system membrane fusion protein